jgi:hypothetical protein
MGSGTSASSPFGDNGQGRGGRRMDGWRQIINLGIAVVALGATAALVAAAWFNRFDPVLSDLVVKNFAAIIGLPFAFIASFVVVALFRQGTGPIEFDGFGLHFKGASGRDRTLDTVLRCDLRDDPSSMEELDALRKS